MTESLRHIADDSRNGIFLDANGKVCVVIGNAVIARFDADGMYEIDGIAGLSGATVLGDTTRRIQLFPTAFGPGSTDPGATRIGTFYGWQFDADAESKHLGPVIVPADWDAASDMYLDLWWIPESGAAIGDTKTVKWDATWRSKAAGEVADAGTAGAMTATYTQSGSGTDKEIIKTSLTVDYDDSDQPLAAGDLLSILLDRDMTGDSYASDAVLIKAELRYTSNKLAAI